MSKHLDNPDEEPVVRPFSDWLREQSKGRSHDELSNALRDLALRVTETGKKGTLVYKISIEQMKDGVALLVKDSVVLNLPEWERDPSLFWTDGDGNLRRQDPNQLVFDSLREVTPADVVGRDNIREA